MKAGFGTGVAPEPGEPARTVSFVPPSTEDLAKLFPQLEVVELLGQGGMGAVYKARQPGLDRLIALKILPPQIATGPGFAERFTREARALARLTHPNIVAVHDFGRANGFHYFIMEFVDGANLRQIEQTGRLAPREALRIVPQICEALQFAHDEGVVHRDIKPENILIDKRGRVKIADFGIAKILGQAGDATLTGAKDVVGTPHYMAPEQVEKPQTVDHRADIYSLGVVFYEMLTGELPLGKFAAPSRKVQVDVRLDEVVLHALEKEPDRRYQHASQVRTDVETIAANTGKPQGSGGLPFGRIGGAWKVAAIVAVVMLVLAMLVSALFLRPGPTADGPASKRVPETTAAHGASAQRVPPVVIQSVPETGSADVDPELTEIRVTFSKPMRDASWSWVKLNDETSPRTTGQPRYLDHGRTWILPVKLQPGRVYAMWLNTEVFTNFRDTGGQPALPYLLIFQTRR